MLKKHTVYRLATKTSCLFQFYLFGFMTTGLLTLSSTLQANDASQYLTMGMEQLLDVEIVTVSKYTAINNLK